MMYRPFENKLNIVLSKHQLYRAQWSIMYYLFHEGPATHVEISQYLSVEKPTVTRTISRLEELGYAEQVPGKDRREKRMQLTELGKSVYLEVRASVDEFERDILQGISEEEQLETIRIMKAIRNNILK